mmetsp:Transcript_670/g.1724  ORF Transcript_670/g.1724 Transcript_670/m.1724 type:complete len:233 (+) Transcript_670:398-1096(+)
MPLLRWLVDRLHQVGRLGQVQDLRRILSARRLLGERGCGASGVHPALRCGSTRLVGPQGSESRAGKHCRLPRYPEGARGGARGGHLPAARGRSGGACEGRVQLAVHRGRRSLVGADWTEFELLRELAEQRCSRSARALAYSVEGVGDIIKFAVGAACESVHEGDVLDAAADADDIHEGHAGARGRHLPALRLRATRHLQEHRGDVPVLPRRWTFEDQAREPEDEAGEEGEAG